MILNRFVLLTFPSSNSFFLSQPFPSSQLPLYFALLLLFSRFFISLSQSSVLLSFPCPTSFFLSHSFPSFQLPLLFTFFFFFSVSIFSFFFAFPLFCLFLLLLFFCFNLLHILSLLSILLFSPSSFFLSQPFPSS